MIAGHQPFQQMGELKMLHNNATHPFPEAKKQYIAALLKSFHCNHLEMNGNFTHRVFWQCNRKDTYIVVCGGERHKVTLHQLTS